VIIIFLGTMIFPTQSFTTFYESFNNYRGLDGEAWMEKDMPEKYKAIQFLRENVDGKNMIEAVGDSYTQLNAVSVFSGVPTVQGWRVHEWLWRGGYDSVATREAEVRQFYETSDIEKQKELIEKYRIGWILVGNDEREHYQIDEESLSLLGEKIWSDGETYLIKVK
jgi:uncharacterized membrane protein